MWELEQQVQGRSWMLRVMFELVKTEILQFIKWPQVTFILVPIRSETMTYDSLLAERLVYYLMAILASSVLAPPRLHLFFLFQALVLPLFMWAPQPQQKGAVFKC